MGIPLLTGRDFNWFDRNGTPPGKVIVNQTFAGRFFPGRNPIGQRLGFPDSSGLARAEQEIIGLASDAKYRSLREPIPPIVYSPVVDGFESGFILHVRTHHRPETMIAPVRKVLWSLDPELPFVEVHTLHEEVEASLWQERLLAWLSTTFAAIAAVLASIGLYGALLRNEIAHTRDRNTDGLGCSAGSYCRFAVRRNPVLDCKRGWSRLMCLRGSRDRDAPNSVWDPCVGAEWNSHC